MHMRLCPLTVKHILEERIDFNDVHNEYVVASSTNELFENVDIRNVHSLLNRRFRRCPIGVELHLITLLHHIASVNSLVRYAVRVY